MTGPTVEVASSSVADAGTSADVPRAGPGWPLRRYLIGLVALFLTATGLGIWSAWAQSEADALSAARADAAYGARMAAAEVGRQLTVVRATSQQIAANPSIRKAYTAPEECELAFSVGGGADGGHLDVLRYDGTVACSSRPPTGAADGYRGATWLAAAATGPQLLAPVVDARTGRQALLVSTPIDKLGVVVAFVDLPALGKTIGDQFGGVRNLEFLLTGADATILTRWPDGAQWAGRSASDSSFAALAGAGEGRDVAGNRRLYGTSAVDGAGWRVYAGAARGPALAAAYRLARQQAMIATAGMLLALAATFLVYRRIIRPISQLRIAVRAAAVSNGAQVAIAVPGPQEVVELGVAFDHLLTAVDRELGERRRAEEAAREHELNYRQLFDASPYPIYLFDVGTLAIIEANDAAADYYGYSRAVLHSMTVLALCPPEDGSAVAADIAAAEPVERSHQQRQLRGDGSVAEVSITSHQVSIGGRTVRCAVVEDITEREHLDRRLRQSQRLESLGQLAGGIAHDFNNLLGVIVGYAAMSAAELRPLAESDPTWRTLHDDLEQIVAAGERATGLTRQLLSFARADAVAELRVLDLNSVVADVEKLLRRTIGEDIALNIRLAEQSWLVKADAGQLEQVLLNLAVNARDAMAGGGALTIDCEPVNVDDHYAAQHPGLRVGRYMRLRVSDTGSGMSRATLERAFEPFFTTKPKGHGTGLGLATIHGIINQAGGHAQIYSELGHGTTVSALLPATDEDAATAPHIPEAAPDIAVGTILLVEDDEGLRILTERVLARRGYTVLIAATAAEAMHLADLHPRIELLLTDVVMPETDGPTLAYGLRAAHPDMRVIYMSGYTETVLAARSTLPPGATLLNKPVTAHHLLNAVAGVMSVTRQRAPQ